MLHYQSIHPKTLELLKELQQTEFLQTFNLVGGTALALQIGHRKSIDIDLFGRTDFESSELNTKLNALQREIKIIKNSKNINIYSIDQIKVDIVNYHYPWLQPTLTMNGLKLASIEDIAAMKLAAVTGRGTKKDFIDLFFLLKKYSLYDLIDFYNRKYADGSVFMVLKSLTYFEDAESDPLPEMLLPFDWEFMKKTILKAVDDFK
jgi:predicted nucleotidyltransferase component of viral defense system